MVKRIKTLILAGVSSLLFAVPALVPLTARAQVTQTQQMQNVCTGAQELSLTASGTDCSDVEAENTVNNTVKLVVNIFSIVVGIIAVIMIIVGGVKYITSGGDTNNVTSAKNTILYAIIGLVVVALAQIIVRFVLSRTVSDAGG